MERIAGTKPKPSTPNPLIEIYGEVDRGKLKIAQLVGKSIGATVLVFPNITEGTYTSSVILSVLRSERINSLDTGPEWWSLIYLAHLYEYVGRINQALEKGPVVVLNYVTGWRIWSRALGFAGNGFAGLTSGLPKPDRTFCIVGPLWKDLSGFSPEFPDWITRRVNTAVRRSTDRWVRKIEVRDGAFKHFEINASVRRIVETLEQEYNRGWKSQRYHPRHFLDNVNKKKFR